MLNNEFAIGTISSVISYGLTYPIDAIKTNYQIANLKQKPSLGDINKLIYMDHYGVRGYYRGFSSILITYPLFWGIFFEARTHSNVMVASGVASLITNPLFVLKTRFQSVTHNFDEGNQYNLTNKDKPIYRKVSYLNLTEKDRKSVV